MTKPAITLVPLLSTWHLRTPRYNTEHVAQAVLAAAPKTIVSSALPADFTNRNEWLDDEQIALPLSVLPAAKRKGIRVVGIAEAPEDPMAEHSLRDYLDMYDEGKMRVRRVHMAFQEAAELLTPAIDLPLIAERIVPALRNWLEVRRTEFGRGPGESWLTERVHIMKERVLTQEGPVVLVVPVEEVAAWLDAFDDGEIVLATEAPANEATKQRSLLDVAFTGEAHDSEKLFHQLADIPTPEAEYHRASILYQTGHLREAVQKLEQVISADFFEPYYLPGFVLGRLGQFYDLLGERDKARKMYRGVLALPYASDVVKALAEAGLVTPFTIEEPEETANE